MNKGEQEDVVTVCRVIEDLIKMEGSLFTVSNERVQYYPTTYVYTDIPISLKPLYSGTSELQSGEISLI